VPFFATKRHRVSEDLPTLVLNQGATASFSEFGAGVVKVVGADFNADGVTDGQDFLAWNIYKFSSSDGVSAVPEPRTAGWSFIAFVIFGLARMRWGQS